MALKKKYKFDNSNTLILLADNRKVKRQYSELAMANKIIDHVKRNKTMYFKLVVTIALYFNYNNISYAATSNDYDIGPVAWEVIHMVLVFAKYGCLGKGIMNMTQEMLQGANLKDALSEGIQYFIFYIVLNVYPKLFSMVKF